MVYVLVVVVAAAMLAPAVVAVLGDFPVLGELAGALVTLGLVLGDLLAVPAAWELVAAE